MKRACIRTIVGGLVFASAGFLPGLAAGAEPVLTWSGYEKDPHPCLYLTTGDVVRLRRERPDLAAMPPVTGWTGDQNHMDEMMASVLIAGNTAAERRVVAAALKSMDALIAKLPDTLERNVGPHSYARQFGVAVGLADAALAATSITAEERGSLVGKIAKAGYMLNDRNYWDLEGGKGSLCPNMKTSAEFYRLAIAALIPSHPMARTWFDGALGRLKEEVDGWVDPAGGMIECPHYSMVIYDQWIGSFLIARNAGAADSGFLFDPKLRRAIEWFGAISTPRDPRNGGFRRLPTLGHTYLNERTGMFGTMAALWKDRDPEFAATLAWMDREHGSFAEPGILSYYPAMMGYRLFFRDSGVQPKAPAWGSRAYPETGVQFRDGIGSDRETALYMIAGRNHSHYYNDSGSITLWGKGRELCDEDSYQFPRGKESRAAHSMPDKPATFNEERVMALREFSASNRFDYVRGTRRGWQRQIAFAKDADPAGPRYFMMADTFDATSVPTAWRLFLAAAEIKPNGTGVTAVGRDDVDLDIVFLGGTVKPGIESNHIRVAIGEAGTFTVLLYPRLKTEKPATVTPFAGGKGARVDTASGTDYLFLSPEPLALDMGGVAFEGKAGLVQVRGGKPVVSVPGPCDVAPGWEGGDRELRTIRWKGPQYPVFPDE